MAKSVAKTSFLADLRQRIGQNQNAVAADFQSLATEVLEKKPASNEWSVLECFDHLNLTHDYYMPKIEQALAGFAPVATISDDDSYKPSFWGRIYMHFAFNPKYSFATADEITPASNASPAVMDVYLEKQSTLLDLLVRVEDVDLRKTAVAIESFVKFNLGDCLKVLVYHDQLHIDQASRALAAIKSAT